MLVTHARKLIRWTMLLCVIALVSGCETVPANYCAIAQKPYQWKSDAEIDATPIGPLRHIEEGASLYKRQGCK